MRTHRAVSIFLICSIIFLVGNRAKAQKNYVEECRKLGFTQEHIVSACGRNKESYSVTLHALFNAEFNAELSELRNKQSELSNKKDYQPRTVKMLTKSYGLDEFDDPRARQAINARFVTSGRLGHYDPEPGKRGQRTYYLDSEGPETSWQVDVDIESLNRHERKFINEMCGSTSDCQATVFGRIGKIRPDWYGLILDHIEILELPIPPLPWKKKAAVN